MADYNAVLKRTLAGFPDPKPQLRTKLYDRARATIRRQLENRSPPVVGDDLQAEMDKLEWAIYDIENGFDPSYPEPVLTSQPAGPDPASGPGGEQAAAAAPVVEQASPEYTQVPAAETASPHGVAPVAEAAPAPAQAETETPPPPPEEPPAKKSGRRTFAEALTGGAFSRSKSKKAAAAETAPPPPPAPEPQAPPPAPEPPAPPPVPVETLPPQPMPPQPMPPETLPPAYDPAAAAAAVAAAAQPDYGTAPVHPGQQTVHDDAVDQWAQEFLAHQPPAETAPQYAPIDPALQPVPDYNQGYDPAYGQPPAMQPPPPPPPPPTQFDSPFGPSHDGNLAIPNAPGFGSGGTKPPRRKRGIFKWIFILIMLAVIGGAGYYGWINKEQVLAQIGLEDLFENPTRPKPVKTITITPEPESSGELLSPTKLDNRLNGNGEEEKPEQPAAVEVPELQDLSPVQQPQPAASDNNQAGGLPVAQNAILYEEGATPTENSVDSGRVIWSVVQEAPATGQPEEPAIRARIEIASRNVVLLMTLKRNIDKALPASHLIELVFAVPDDFAGGAVGQINRFVLKQSEQGRGENLIGVPARIADGIFLIALNNLEEARVKNENLLQTGNWIDLPMQYSTGRRALMTIEKGVPGSKVFEEVFAAWSKL